MSARFATTVERGAPCATATYTPDTAAGAVAAATVRSCILLSPASGAAAAGDGGATQQPPSAAADGRPVVACTRGLLATPDVGRAPGRLELSFPPHPPGRFWVLAATADGGGGGADDDAGGGGADAAGGGARAPPARYTTAVVWSCAEAESPGRAAAQDLMVLARVRNVARADVDAAAAAAEAGGVALGADNGMLMTDQGPACVYFDDAGAAVVEG